MNPTAKIYIVGHRGLVGSALVRNLQDHGYNNLLTRTHVQLDLTNRAYSLAKIAGIEMCGSYNRQHGAKFLVVMSASAFVMPAKAGIQIPLNLAP